jgi:hypothetical protein
LLFSQGEWPYRSNDSYPFYSSNYPPLFHVVIVPLVWLFGPQYWTGRLISFLSTLVTAVAIGYAVSRGDPVRGRGRWWLAALSGLAFLASNYVYHVGPLFRQHMFMVMFETLAIVLLTVLVEQEEGDGRRHNRSLFLVMVLLLFAGYTKQLAYATVAAVFIFLFLRQPRRAVLWAVPFALVTGLIFLAINIATDGQWLLNTITANLNPFIPGQAEGLFRQWFSLHMVVVSLASFTLSISSISTVCQRTPFGSPSLRLIALPPANGAQANPISPQPSPRPASFPVLPSIISLQWAQPGMAQPRQASLGRRF